MNTSDFNSYFKKTYRSHTSSFLSGTMLMFVDIFALFITLGLSFLLVNFFIPTQINFKSFIYYSAYTPLILFVYYAAGLYPGIMISPSDEVRKLSVTTFFCFMGIGLSILFQEPSTESTISKFTYSIVKDSRSWAVIVALLVATPFSAIILPASREIGRHIFGHLSFWGVPAVIYVTGDSGNEVIKRLVKRKDLGYKPAIIIDSLATDCSMFMGIPVFPESQEILDTIKKLKFKVAIMCHYKGNRKLVFTSYRYTITTSKNQDAFTSTMNIRDIGGIIGFSATHNLTRKGYLFFKKLLDLLIILIFLPILLPVMLILAILVKLTSRGPIFYGHKRVGKNGKIIKCWKFRSMVTNSQEMLEHILATDPVRAAEWEKDRKFVDDPRVTKFGKFLRKTSLDELPQLFNIIAGQMSFVGPRPVTESELEKYGDCADYVLSVTPGLSGMWQISGRSDTGYEERIMFDTYYIQNWSIWLDIWILIKTVWVVVKGKGAY